MEEVCQVSAGQHIGWRGLIGGVLYVAYADFCSSDDLTKSIDALLWLASNDAYIYTEALDLDSDPLRPVSMGQRVKYKGVRYVR